MIKNSIEEDIKIALDKFSDNKDIDSAILIVEKFILGNYILRGGRKNIVKDSLRYILSDYKRVLKENEELKYKVEGQECVIETQAHNEEVYERIFERLEKEKQDYFEKYRYHLQQNGSLTKEFSNVIPIQKVKDKIEEIGEKIKYEENEKVVIYLHKQKNILQELLESEE